MNADELEFKKRSSYKQVLDWYFLHNQNDVGCSNTPQTHKCLSPTIGSSWTEDLRTAEGSGGGL